MPLLEVAGLTFGYIDPPLFEGVSFRLEEGERAALVAPNGAGKSTLLRLIVGELLADRGQALVRKGARVGYYRQSHEAKPEGNVLEALLGGFAELSRLRRELSRAQHAAADGTPESLNALAEAMDRYQLSGADQLERRVEVIATRLGFGPADLDRPVATLSGGERGRLALGVVLAAEPDLLLLDEPTNHLDLESIRWLEQHLVELGSAALVVSHDRAFLDAVCPTTLELGRTSFRSYPLSYTPYQAARAADLERERKLADEQAAFIDRTQDFIRRNLAGQKTKQAQSRRRMLEKLERLDRPEDVWARAERVRFRFAEAPRSGDIVLEATGLGALRGGRRLFGSVDLLVRRGDRIGIVGPNGSGKSTLLALLGGRGGDLDEGTVRRGTNLREGYFDQHLGELDVARTAVEEIRSVRADLNVDAARAYLARFRFQGDDPLRRVASFSGGERTRLALAKLLLEPRNLLFLDEPTNHLDLPAAEILEEALVGFEGTLLLVSHDRRFLENVTTRLVVFTGQAVEVHEEGYLDYTRTLARRAAAAETAPAPEKPRRARDSAGDPRDADRARQRDAERRRRRVAELERAIAAAEAELEALRARLREAEGADWEQLHAWAGQEQAVSRKVEGLMTEWVTLSEALSRHEDRTAGA